MEDSDIDQILEEEGIDKEKLEAALELARLVAEETGLCCEGLGRFAWGCYRRLEGDHE
jgi:hypothetical protein